MSQLGSTKSRASGSAGTDVADEYRLPLKTTLVDQIHSTVVDAEQLLDKWELKIHYDTAHNIVQTYAFP